MTPMRMKTDVVGLAAMEKIMQDSCRNENAFHCNADNAVPQAAKRTASATSFDSHSNENESTALL